MGWKSGLTEHPCCEEGTRHGSQLNCVPREKKERKVFFFRRFTGVACGTWSDLRKDAGSMMPSADRRGSTCTCTAVLHATDKVIRHWTRERGLFISLSLSVYYRGQDGHSNMHCACTYSISNCPPIQLEVSSFVELDSLSPLKERKKEA